MVEALLKLVDGESYGNPENLLRWTKKSLRNLSDELAKEGHKASLETVGRILVENAFSLQQNQKMPQVGVPHPDRDEQFRFINETTKSEIALGEPVISVDCKKKGHVGNYKNAGVEHSPLSK